jgi:hypothetical protein
MQGGADQPAEAPTSSAVRLEVALKEMINVLERHGLLIWKRLVRWGRLGGGQFGKRERPDQWRGKTGTNHLLDECPAGRPQRFQRISFFICHRGGSLGNLGENVTAARGYVNTAKRQPWKAGLLRAPAA